MSEPTPPEVLSDEDLDGLTPEQRRDAAIDRMTMTAPVRFTRPPDAEPDQKAP